ncbi:MAG: hypothetical protein IJU45_08970 [Clostridia bacterium]|nr:hypothetical protein [Clostridia bacterium]
MTNNEKKAEQFIKSINAQADKKYNQIKKEIDDYVSSELRKARVQARQNAKTAAKLEMSKRSEQSNTDSYKTRSQLIMQIVEKRSGITDEVFSKAQKKIEEFVESDGYLPFLLKSVESIKEAVGENAVIRIRPEDEKYSDEIKKHCAGVETDDTIKIGGCKGINTETSMKADDTLDSRLAAQRELFYEQSGLSIV